ncbi:complex I NDUFA9 subunit family protein [Candidatus Pelagibacter sp.]|nr:complex I NDUFA9 subunit family protein [Candidatus Pelagibacter sp.]
MKLKNCLIFGASGFIGRNLIKKLCNNNFKVTVITRNLHKSLHLKTQSAPGYIEIVESSIFDENKLRDLIKNSDVCINLIGILYEKGQLNTFINIHEKFPNFLSALCNEHKVKQLISISALGVEQALDSAYATSKLNGENYIKKNFKSATILKPSIVYGNSPDDFSNKFMQLLNVLPIFPLYYSGRTLFAPIYVTDLVEIIYQVIVQDIKSKTIECVGPEQISLKEILKKLLKLMGKKRLLFPMPLIFAKLLAKFFQLFPKPLLTTDQLTLLKYNNIPSGRYKTNYDLGIISKSNFENEIKKYSWMYSNEGEYSKDKYKEII